MAQADMPTMRSRRLGNELRRLRSEAELTTQDAADTLECGKPKISQIENGKRGIRQLDLTLLLDLYGVTDDTYRVNLKRLAKDIHRVDWWSGQAPLLHDALRDYLTLESDSHLMRAYEPKVLPGLLQTEDYMRAVFVGAGEDPERTEQLIQIRLKRQELLKNSRDFRLRTVIDAPALHRIHGGSELIVEQLNHLLQVGKRSNIHIQVLPLEAPLPMEQYGPFAILNVEGEPPVELVWLEHITGGTLLEQRPDVQVYSKTWEELTAAALSLSASQQYIRDLIEESGP
ncbi:helix-turn-helix transcriptional regulator [Streptomyces sp. Z26]|uniref:helix-turn-helix domain-containing protein n=1 Tax=Streptomyces sp. Z26 TaxID=2500177 RepID=UPI000EF17316|nr:helix-turn-helix transcriptional regulator [Streptomyces sp. Z26]RLL70213.1 XRE family transcriptional regulator [Streptomyces sp. Z26]